MDATVSAIEPAEIDRLIDASDFAGARSALASYPEGDERVIVLRIKLGLREERLPPGAAMQQLIQIMRQNEHFPGAKELYQEASSLAWQARESNVAHSHPPPPATPRRPR
ncbi:MAG TPA: hypothetical protein VFQ61_24255 [Polyangiaceae bacterium]|nr:hypothetical protein [Polyangiaceae bacterium]